MTPRYTMRCMLGAASLLWLGAASPARADATAGLGYFAAGQFSEAFGSWRESADRGDPASALYLGVVYDTGFGVSQDYRQALAWYERSGAEGNVTAMFNAGVMHDAGRGTAADPQAAAVWYQRAADAGYGRAEYNLGMMYQSGSGVGHDTGRAVRLYQAAAGHGVPAARTHLKELGRPYAAVTVRPSVDPAMVSFEQAEHVLLTRGTAQASRAVALFRQAADSGSPLAAYNLAYCYEHGLGVAPDIDQAINWYRRSAATAGDTPIRGIAETGARNLVASISHAQR